MSNKFKLSQYQFDGCRYEGYDKDYALNESNENTANSNNDNEGSPLKHNVIEIKLSDNAVLPAKQHKEDIGFDITAIGVEYDKEHDAYIYHTGISMASDEQHGVYIYPRSSIYKKDAILCNHVAVIDTATYRGEILICFKCRTSLSTRITNARIESFMNAINNDNDIETAKRISDEVADAIKDNPMAFAPYQVGERIAQMIVFEHSDIVFMPHEGEWEDTSRNANGFGSTN